MQAPPTHPLHSIMHSLTRTESARRSRKRQWLSRATLSDSRCPVVDVQFAPRHQGLKLAAARCAVNRADSAHIVFVVHPSSLCVCAARTGSSACTKRSM